MSAFRHTFVDIRGCATSLWRGGSGPTLLFLHGSQGVPRPLPFMEQLAERFDLLAPEHPGFGASDNPAGLASVHDLAYFYLDFIAALRLQRVHVVGQALGGWIAAEMAVRNTAGIASLVLAGAPGLRTPQASTLDVFGMSDVELAPLLFHDPALAASAGVRAAAMDAEGAALARRNRVALERIARACHFEDPDLHKWLHRIDVPTLLLWGAQDRAVPPAIGEAYAALIPGARRVLLPDCGHLPHVEQVGAYVEAVAGFALGRGA